MLPNFLIIGAAKGGTTTLQYILAQHPEVFMCPVKEPGFFWSYGEEVAFRGPGAEVMRHRIVSDPQRYEKLFASVRGEKAIGEASVRYLAHPRAPELIHQFIPGAKLVASLRQPAERAYSSFTRNLRDGLEPCKDFAEAIEQEKHGLRNGWTYARYLEKGFYAAALERYRRYFDPRQMHISLYEDLRDHPQDLFRSLFRFLGVDETFAPDLSQKHNVSGIIRNPILRLAWTRTNRLRALVRPWFSPRARHAFSEWVIQDLERLELDPGVRLELTETYREDILRLQELIGRDLSGWLEPAGQAGTG